MVLPEKGAAQLRWLEIILAATLVLNLVDVTLTILWVESGYAVEANPLMEVAIDYGALPFAVAKLLLVSGGCYLLWRLRKRQLAAVGIVIVFLAYYAITIQHAGAIGELAVLAFESVSGQR
jgi:hypothetical protein